MFKINNIIITLSSFSVCCIIVAVVCLLNGESETLNIKSHTMRKYIGIVVNNNIIETKDAKLKGYCHYKYDDNKICIIKDFSRKIYEKHSNGDDGDDGITKLAALVEINERCPINSTRTICYDYNTHSCDIIDKYIDMANTGVVFTIVGIIAIFVFYSIFEKPLK